MKTFFLLALGAGLCVAQAPPTASLVNDVRSVQGLVKGNIIKAAEKMPAEFYSYRPTPDVRSFAELVGHVADANYGFCSVSLADKNPGLKIEESIKTTPTKTKESIIEDLKASFAYCDKAYAAFSDANSMEPLKMFGSRTRTGVLSFETAHLFEHYGNIVTYMRLKSIVPPSSEPRK